MLTSKASLSISFSFLFVDSVRIGRVLYPSISNASTLVGLRASKNAHCTHSPLQVLLLWDSPPPTAMDIWTNIHCTDIDDAIGSADKVLIAADFHTRVDWASCSNRWPSRQSTDVISFSSHTELSHVRQIRRHCFCLLLPRRQHEYRQPHYHFARRPHDALDVVADNFERTQVPPYVVRTLTHIVAKKA